MTDSPSATLLKPPVKNPKNIEAAKYYIFNETGNIMLSSTSDTSQSIEESVRKVFAEVSVFFAGMTRAITTSKNPVTGKPYSLFNYHALQQVIDDSGLFVHVTEEDVKYSTDDFGADFSKNLVESLLGLATGAGEMAFASAMVSSLGKEGFRISSSKSDSESKVANIVFVCEHLLGMPMVSAIVVYADCKKHKQQIQAGPCFTEERITTSWELHKDTYFFVTPTFIKNYASELASVESDPYYIELVHWLKGLINSSPGFRQIVDDSGQAVINRTIEAGRKYTLQGTLLGDNGKLKIGDELMQVSHWSPNEISFTVSNVPKDPSIINIFNSSGELIAASSETYQVVKNGK